MSKARLVNFTKASAKETGQSNLMRRMILLETKTLNIIDKLGYAIDEQDLYVVLVIILASAKRNNRYKEAKRRCKQFIDDVKYTKREGHVVNKH